MGKTDDRLSFAIWHVSDNGNSGYDSGRKGSSGGSTSRLNEERLSSTGLKTTDPNRAQKITGDYKGPKERKESYSNI